MEGRSVDGDGGMAVTAHPVPQRWWLLRRIPFQPSFKVAMEMGSAQPPNAFCDVYDSLNMGEME